MTDQSFLDDKYFVSAYTYNCPFCNRGNVKYTVPDKSIFHWTRNKPCCLYIVECSSCGKRSMHLSYHDIEVKERKERGYATYGKFDLTKEQTETGLDEMFFYSVPNSFFVLDRRIPKILRELMTEADGCLKGNFLTGASACARKIIYELAHRNNLTDGNYDDRIRALKDKHSDIDETYFDSLLSIQKATSSIVHENSYDGWEAKHVRLILSSLRQILRELYVEPALRADRRKEILQLQEEVLGDNPVPAEVASDSDDA